MTRRIFLLSAVPGPAHTTRNEVSTAGNDFIALWSKWAREWNASEPGTVSIIEPELFERMSKAFRRLEKKRRDWLKGV
jgi:hypothetical protein